MATDLSQQNGTDTEYSLEAGTKAALQSLLHRARKEVPEEIRSYTGDVIFTSPADNQIYFPCPLKETEAASALKAIEAGAVAAIADIRYGKRKRKRKIEVNLERASCFLFAAYLSTIDGMDKGHPNVKSKLKGREYPKRKLVTVSVDGHRYRPVAGPIDPLSTSVCQLVRNSQPRRVFPPAWIPRGHHRAQHGRLGRPPT